MSALASVLILLGWLISLVGGVWLLVLAAKQQKYVWLVLMLLVPGAALVFVILNWAKAKKPFFVSLAALPLIIAGLALGVNSTLDEVRVVTQESLPTGPRRTFAPPTPVAPELPVPRPEPEPAPPVAEPARDRTPAQQPSPERAVSRPRPAPSVSSPVEVVSNRSSAPTPVAPAASSPPASAPGPDPVRRPSAPQGSVGVEFVKIETPRGERIRFVRLRITNSCDRAVSKARLYLGYHDRGGTPLGSWTRMHEDPDQPVLVGPNAGREFVCPAFFMPDITASVRVGLLEVQFKEPGERRSP